MVLKQSMKIALTFTFIAFKHPVVMIMVSGAQHNMQCLSVFIVYVIVVEAITIITGIGITLKGHKWC